jgi:hypothetical protein
VNLASEARTNHILNGEVRPNGTFGGGHRFGTGFPGKSEFPLCFQAALNRATDLGSHDQRRGIFGARTPALAGAWLLGAVLRRRC